MSASTTCFAFVVGREVARRRFAVSPDVRGTTAVHPVTEPSTFRLERSLIEQNHEIGVFVAGSQATLEASVIRATEQDAGGHGRGLAVQPQPMTGAPSTLLLQRSMLEQNHEIGVW